MIPTSAAIARPDKVTVAPNAWNEIPPVAENPSAHTRMRAAIIVFLDFVKST